MSYVHIYAQAKDDGFTEIQKPFQQHGVHAEQSIPKMHLQLIYTSFGKHKTDSAIRQYLHGFDNITCAAYTTYIYRIKTYSELLCLLK